LKYSKNVKNCGENISIHLLLFSSALIDIGMQLKTPSVAGLSERNLQSVWAINVRRLALNWPQSKPN